MSSMMEEDHQEPPSEQEDESPSPVSSTIPCKLFQKGDRVFAKDVTSGLLYEAVVRRVMLGVTRQQQCHAVMLMTDNNTNNNSSSSTTEEEQPPEQQYHMFVHYLGWNVRHDRWVVGQDSLYEHNEQNTKLAQRLQQVVKEVKEKHRKVSKASRGMKIWKELEQRMKALEQERRAEEKREELAKQGIVMMERDEPQQQQQDEEDSKPAAARRKKWTQAAIDKELSLREQSLQGRRQQALAEKLILPFSLKKIMVDEWEIITQCSMLPNLPASVTVHDALNKYLQSKLELLLPKAKSDDEGQDEEEKGGAEKMLAAIDESVTPKTVAESKEETENDDGLAKKQQEWKDMVEGIEMLFDQTAPKYLLYRQELSQLQDEALITERRPSELLGCEHLLRFFVHLPALLAGQLSDVECRPIYAKLGDLVRFLQKHQSSLFAQSYHPVKDEQERSKAKKRRGGGGGKKRKPPKKAEEDATTDASKKLKSAADPEEQTTTTKMVELPPDAKSEPL